MIGITFEFRNREQFEFRIKEQFEFRIWERIEQNVEICYN